MATEIGADWVYWKTGNVDLLAVAAGEMQRILFFLAVGGLAILAAGVLAAWRFRHKTRQQAA